MKFRTANLLAFVLAAAVAAAIPGASLAAKAAAARSDAPFWTGKPNAAAFSKIEDERLAKARAAIERLAAVKGTRTIENTLAQYDEAILLLDAAAAQAQLIENVHPDSTLRASAEEATQKASALATEISLDRRVYDALSALDVSKADAETQYYVEHELRDFRLAGVDKDDATRASIKALRDTLVKIGQEFDRNIRGDVRTITVASAADLDGLPPDYIASHKPGADGKITLNINYPDYVPAMTYAKSEDVRKRLYMEFQNRAYPKNIEVLDKMLAKRAELARILGFDTWANYITADKMVESAANASAFIDRIVAASAAKATREYEQQLKRKQQDVPGATVVNR